MLEDILIRLENLRQLLHEAAIEKGISHPDVLMISQNLDGLVNEYYTLFLESKRVRHICETQ